MDKKELTMFKTMRRFKQKLSEEKIYRDTYQ